MGSCLSKKKVSASSPRPVVLPDPPEKLKPEIQPERKEETVVKKEVSIIKHRKSHEIERKRLEEEEEKAEIKEVEEFVEKGKIVSSGNGMDGGGGAPAMTTSTCSKEEVDAILIQCGRLSRSSSTGKAALSSEKSGRKYAGSKRSYDFDAENGKCDEEEVAKEREDRRRERQRQPQGRRRTPSRERDQAAQQRSGSRERGGSSSGGGGRRVSRSPGRRSESPITAHGGAHSNSSAANASSRPGKIVSVPATVAVNKTTNSGGGGGSAAGARTAASPRKRSPARSRAANDNPNTQNPPQPASLSRSNSRKAEASPYRRNPLAEIDTNIISQKPNADSRMNSKNATSKNQDSENLKTAVSRSSRLDIDPETMSNPNPNPNTSYTALLLEDINNFHQKNTPPSAFSLPPSVTKACSILEAVADLNSSIGSNLSTTDLPQIPNLINKASSMRKGRQELRDPILESEVVVSDDLMQPSFHKYVTVRRGASAGEEDEELGEQESSGSNSFAGGSLQQWTSSTCWEPNSAESTDRCSRQISRQAAASDEGGMRLSAAKKRSADSQQSGVGRGRAASRVSHLAPAAAAST